MVAYNSVPGSITVEATGKSETFYFITSIRLIGMAPGRPPRPYLIPDRRAWMGRTNHDSADPVADAVNDLNDALMMKSTLLKNHTGVPSLWAIAVNEVRRSNTQTRSWRRSGRPALKSAAGLSLVRPSTPRSTTSSGSQAHPETFLPENETQCLAFLP